MQARTCKLIGITHEGEPFGAIKYAASNNHLISVAKSPGSDEHRAVVQEAQWMDAMLTALFKEGKIIYTGVKKHQLALETIWWLCLFYFPAFRTRWQQDEQTSNGMARKVQDFTPKFNTLLISEAISYPHWSCTDMEVVGQMYTKKAMLSCVVLDSGINVDDLRRNAYAAVSAAHLDRSTVICEWLLQSEVLKQLSSSFAPSFDDTSYELILSVRNALSIDPRLKYATQDSDDAGGYNHLIQLLKELGIKVGHHGSAFGPSWSKVYGIVPIIGTDVNRGSKAIMPTAGTLKPVPECIAFYDDNNLMSFARSCARQPLTTAQMKFLVVQPLELERPKLELELELERPKRSEIKLEGEAKIRVAKPKFKSSQSNTPKMYMEICVPA